MNHARAAIFAALFLPFFAFCAVAQDVTLTSRDGGIEISGNLLGFDGDFDYAALVHQGRGRRIAGGATEQSLLVRKAQRDNLDCNEA